MHFVKEYLKNVMIQASSSASNSTEIQGKCVHVTTKCMYRDVHRGSIPNSPQTGNTLNVHGRNG